MWKPIILDVECIVCNKSLQKINHDPGDVTRKMGKITNRRSRTPNWSVEEKQYLLELINERKDVVVNKTTNGPNHYEEKDVAWNEILRELTAKFGDKFSGSSIKKVKTQWQNMKRIAREEITLNGPEVEKYSRQSLEVCLILDLVKDGVLKSDENSTRNLNDTTTTITTNVEIKTERIDEDQSCCNGSSMDVEMDQPLSTLRKTLENSIPIATTHLQSVESPTSSESEKMDESFEPQNQEQSPVPVVNRKHVSANTDPITYEAFDLNPFHRNIQEFLKFTSAEKQLKLESLKEERQVMRAMRETAELNKIIAEQRLKHLLWIKKHEMAMYSGEPGSGAGKGGGAGGAVREAGGAFGRMEAAREDEYFYKKQIEQLANIKQHIKKEIAFHEEQIKRHEDAIKRHKDQMGSMSMTEEK